MAKLLQLALAVLFCSALLVVHAEEPESHYTPKYHESHDTSDGEYVASPASSAMTDASSEEKLPYISDSEPSEEESSGEEIDPEREAQEELDLMDTDKDGKVSIEELETYFQKEFYDEEFMAAEEGPAHEPGTPTPQEDMIKMVKEDAKEFMEDMDTKKDGFLDLEEMIEQYKFDAANPDFDDSSDEGEDRGHKFQQEREDQFYQTSDDEYSGDDSDDESAPEYYDDSSDFSDDSDYSDYSDDSDIDFSDEAYSGESADEPAYNEHSQYLTDNSADERPAVEQAPAVDPMQ
jgi:hypothetical protein